MSRSSKTCKACGSTGGLTKHHVYPRYLRDIWRDRVEQAIALLCRTCHDVVHYREGRYGARRAKKYEYVRLFSDVNAQKVLGKYRKIIRTLERASKALHVTGNVDEELMAFFQDFCIKT
jgi:hypothetical protein